jgi:hypothetical protein
MDAQGNPQCFDCGINKGTLDFQQQQCLTCEQIKKVNYASNPNDRVYKEVVEHRICYHGSLENEKANENEEAKTKFMVGYDYMKAHRESFVKFLFVWLLITCVWVIACLIPCGIVVVYYLRG